MSSTLRPLRSQAHRTAPPKPTPREDDAEERLLADAVRHAIDWTFTGGGPHQIAFHSHAPAVLGDAQSRNVITRTWH